MTSSNYYEIRILRDGPAWSVRPDALALPWTASEPLLLDAEENFAVAVPPPLGNPPRLRVRLANEVIAEAPAGVSHLETARQAWLRNEFGESTIVVEQESETGPDDEPGVFTVLFDLGLEVKPRPEVARDFRVMIEDVTAVHEGLAQDIIHRPFVKKRLHGTREARLPPEAVLKTLQDLAGRLERVVAQIAEQPSVMLDRSARVARYRGGDRIDAAALSVVARDPETRTDRTGRITSLG